MSPAPATLTPRGLLWRAVRSRPRDLAVACVLYSTHQLGEALVPVIIGATISRAVDGGTWSDIVWWLLVLAADFVFLSFSFRLGARASMRAKQHAGHATRMWLTERVVEPAGGIDHSPGDLLSRASSDAGRVGAYAGMLAIAVAAGVALLASTLLLVGFSLLLGAVILLGTALLLLAQDRVSTVLLRRSVDEQHEQARATALAEDLVRGLRVLRGIRAQRAAAGDYRAVSRRAVGAAVSAASSAATIAAVGALLSGVYLTVIAAVGGGLALSGSLGLGQLVSALGLARFVLGPMQVLSTASAAYARALASAGRVQEILRAGPAVPEPDAGLLGADGAATDTVALRLDGVRIGERGPLLDAVFPGGSMTGVACTDPAVAAEIVDLLAREHDPAEGRLQIGDATRTWDDATRVSLSALRERVLVSPHDAVLLPGTVADNLALLAVGDPASSVHAAAADQVLASVPHGAGASVGDRGERLSGGQRQRVALARALAAAPPALVLHDPTTAVDSVTEDVVAERTHRLRTGRTTVVVTTSPAWLGRCEQVWYVGPDDAQQGTHAELQRRDPDYRELVTR